MTKSGISSSKWHTDKVPIVIKVEEYGLFLDGWGMCWVYVSVQRPSIRFRPGPTWAIKPGVGSALCWGMQWRWMEKRGGFTQWCCGRILPNFSFVWNLLSTSLFVLWTLLGSYVIAVHHRMSCDTLLLCDVLSGYWLVMLPQGGGVIMFVVTTFFLGFILSLWYLIVALWDLELKKIPFF